MEQIDDAVVGASYDSLNRLVSRQPSGALRVAGTLSEPATVTVDGKPATVTAADEFSGTVPVSSGTTTFSVSARDASGNVQTDAFEVEIAGSSETLTYDDNGNLISDGTQTFEWDARNQLVAVEVGTHRSEFTYDGRQQRVRIVEIEDSTTESDTYVIWCGTVICEERDADETTVTRRVFDDGEEIDGASHYFAKDHLGSVTDVTSDSETVLARYTFDPWGRRTLAAGDDVTTVGYTGHWSHSSGVSLTLYRSYDPDVGRWMSEDPAGLSDGPNRFSYVGNDPINRVDRLGLQWGWLFPGSDKWKNRLTEGIDLFWANCPVGERLFAARVTVSRETEREKWTALRNEFVKKCTEAASDGRATIAFATPFPGLALPGTGWGVFVCCEYCPEV